ncbi:MAG: hypothetical protein ABI718_12670 [Acidobacteriota bacterium]
MAQQAPLKPVQTTPHYPLAAPVKSGSSALKIFLVIVLLAGAAVVMAGIGAFYYGKKRVAEWREKNGVAATLPISEASTGSNRQSATSSNVGDAFLSKEEVGAIVGTPVTSIEMSGKTDATYKFANVMMEASIEIERKNDPSDAIQDMEAARLVTRRGFGGKAETVAGVGDDALYGALNVLYVRRNDIILTISPPNLQYAAKMDQYNNMKAQPMGSEGQRKAMEEFTEPMKGDPGMAALAKPDAMSGAVDMITHSATEVGGEYETKARLMARQMAEKVLAKLGS